MRDGAEVFTGSIGSLRRMTEDVKEVAEGYECGLALENFNTFQEGDIIEFYRKERVS
jgi:translation initiation factor IF-2